MSRDSWKLWTLDPDLPNFFDDIENPSTQNSARSRATLRKDRIQELRAATPPTANKYNNIIKYKKHCQELIERRDEHRFRDICLELENLDPNKHASTVWERYRGLISIEDDFKYEKANLEKMMQSMRTKFADYELLKKCDSNTPNSTTEKQLYGWDEMDVEEKELREKKDEAMDLKNREQELLDKANHLENQFKVGRDLQDSNDIWKWHRALSLCKKYGIDKPGDEAGAVRQAFDAMLDKRNVLLQKDAFLVALEEVKNMQIDVYRYVHRELVRAHETQEGIDLKSNLHHIVLPSSHYDTIYHCAWYQTHTHEKNKAEQRWKDITTPGTNNELFLHKFYRCAEWNIDQVMLYFKKRRELVHPEEIAYEDIHAALERIRQDRNSPCHSHYKLLKHVTQLYLKTRGMNLCHSCQQLKRKAEVCNECLNRRRNDVENQRVANERREVEEEF